MGRNIFTFIVASLLMIFFSTVTIFAAEITDVLQLSKSEVAVNFSQEGEDTVMTWTPLPYPCVYTIETFNETTGLVRGEPKYHLLTTDESNSASYVVPRAPIPTFYSISARGFFRELFETEEVIANPNFPTPPSPVTIYHYPEDAPASLMPLIVWHVVPTAV